MRGVRFYLLIYLFILMDCHTLCVHSAMFLVHQVSPGVGSAVGRIDLLRFLAGCRKRRLNQA